MMLKLAEEYERCRLEADILNVGPLRFGTEEVGIQTLNNLNSSLQTLFYLVLCYTQ